MAATSKTHSAGPKRRAGTGGQVRSKTMASNLAENAKPVPKHSDEGMSTGSKTIGLADALREEGIDERTIARGFASLHSKLSGSEDKGDLKLFFDVLKDNHRSLEPQTPSDRSSAGDAPVTIILKHNMARPARETKAGASDLDRLSTRHASEGCSFTENC
jgi:hypothetical protein